MPVRLFTPTFVALAGAMLAFYVVTSAPLFGERELGARAVTLGG